MGEMKSSQILSAAADLIEPEGRWTQGALSRNRKGEWVPESQKSAVCFCAMGAIWRSARDLVGSDVSYRHADPASNVLREVVGGPVADWNDAPARKQAEVVTALRQAAEKAREAGQ